MNEWIQAHLQQGGFLGAIAIGLFYLVKLLFKREAKRWDEDRETRRKGFEDHENRIRAMEANRVTRSDMDELRMSLMASINLVHTDLSRSMNAVQSDVRLLTDHLLGKK